MVTPGTNSVLQRLLGAAALDTAIDEEVEADRGATGQAFGVVIVSSLAAGIGARGLGGTNPASIAFISMVALLAWAAWAVVTYQIGGRLLPEPQTSVDVGELLRTIGFAAPPGLLRVFGVLPGVTLPVFAIYDGLDDRDHDRGGRAGVGLYEHRTLDRGVRAGLDAGDRDRRHPRGGVWPTGLMNLRSTISDLRCV